MLCFPLIDYNNPESTLIISNPDIIKATMKQSLNIAAKYIRSLLLFEVISTIILLDYYPISMINYVMNKMNYCQTLLSKYLF